MARLSGVAALLLLVACASVEQRCDTLYFGTSKQDGTAVSAADWSAFVGDTITPRFPGFTEWTARGYWKGASEETHVVTIVHASTDDGAIAQIIDAYKKRFAQEAVLRVRASCAARAE